MTAIATTTFLTNFKYLNAHGKRAGSNPLFDLFCNKALTRALEMQASQLTAQLQNGQDLIACVTRCITTVRALRETHGHTSIPFMMPNGTYPTHMNTDSTEIPITTSAASPSKFERELKRALEMAHRASPEDAGISALLDNLNNGVRSQSKASKGYNL